LPLSSPTSNGLPSSLEVTVWNSLPMFTNLTVVPADTRSSCGAYVHAASRPTGSMTWTSFGRTGGTAVAPLHAASASRSAHAAARKIQRRVTTIVRASSPCGCVLEQIYQGEESRRVRVADRLPTLRLDLVAIRVQLIRAGGRVPTVPGSSRCVELRAQRLRDPFFRHEALCQSA